MKKQELKNILKPLIKECIRESIFEEGMLSGLIKEVVQGLDTRQVVAEAETADFSRNHSVELQESAKKDLQNRRSKLEQSMGGNFKGIFENVEPTSAPASSGGNSPLSTYAPSDAGVDISGILSIGGSNWKNMI